MEKKEKQVGIIMAVVISAIMGLLFAWIARKNSDPAALSAMPPAPIMFLISIVESIIVGVILVLIVPIGKLGNMLTEKFGAKPPSVKFTLINSIPFAVINAIVVGGVVSFISIAQAHSHIPAEVAPPLFAMWFGQWIKTLPISILVGYVFAVIISPFVVKAVGLGGPPNGAGGPPDVPGGPPRPGDGSKNA